jgi:hypothetical protein
MNKKQNEEVLPPYKNQIIEFTYFFFWPLAGAFAAPFTGSGAFAPFSGAFAPFFCSSFFAIHLTSNWKNTILPIT